MQEIGALSFSGNRNCSTNTYPLFPPHAFLPTLHVRGHSDEFGAPGPLLFLPPLTEVAIPGTLPMRRLAHIVGIIALTLAAMLALLGILSWPPGGLMFALLFFFLLPAAALAVFGTLLLAAAKACSRASKPSSREM